MFPSWIFPIFNELMKWPIVCLSRRHKSSPEPMKENSNLKSSQWSIVEGASINDECGKRLTMYLRPDMIWRTPVIKNASGGVDTVSLSSLKRSHNEAMQSRLNLQSILSSRILDICFCKLWRNQIRRTGKNQESEYQVYT